MLSPSTRRQLSTFGSFRICDVWKINILDRVGPTGDWRHNTVRIGKRSSYDTDSVCLTTVSQFGLQSAVSCAGSWVIHKQNTVLRRVAPALCGQVGGRGSFIVCLVCARWTPAGMDRCASTPPLRVLFEARNWITSKIISHSVDVSISFSRYPAGSVRRG